MSATIDMKDLVGKRLTLNVKVKRVREWRLRRELALALIRLAAWIMWVSIEIEESD